jgi:putative phage-type endonuclease
MTATPELAPAYGSAEWQHERRAFIGASDVPMILGLSPFGSAYDVWLAKRGLEQQPENDAMRWGHYHEANIAREYQRRFPNVKLEEIGTLPDPRRPWLRATVDRLVHAEHGAFPLEIKSTSEYLGGRWGDENTDDIPDHVLVQAQVQLMVLNVSFAHVAVLIGHSDCRMPYIVEADRELQQMIIDGCEDFYQRYLNGDEEPPITGPNTEAHLRKKYQSHSREVIRVDRAAAELMEQFFAARAIRKDAEKREGELKPLLMQLIGSNYGIECDAGRCLWYEVKGRSSIDYKGLVAHLNVPEDVLNQFMRTGAPSRTFRPYPKGD